MLCICFVFDHFSFLFCFFLLGRLRNPKSAVFPRKRENIRYTEKKQNRNKQKQIATECFVYLCFNFPMSAVWQRQGRQMDGCIAGSNLHPFVSFFGLFLFFWNGKMQIWDSGVSRGKKQRNNKQETQINTYRAPWGNLFPFFLKYSLFSIFQWMHASRRLKYIHIHIRMYYTDVLPRFHTVSLYIHIHICIYITYMYICTRMHMECIDWCIYTSICIYIYIFYIYGTHIVRIFF